VGEFLLDLLRRDHPGLKTALFHPLFTFFSLENRAMLLKKGYDWVKNSSFFPPSWPIAISLLEKPEFKALT